MVIYSIIVPTYNNAERIEKTIDSVLNQTLKNWELIIIDDGSIDKTEKVVKPYLDNPKIKYFKQDNAGVSSARNNGTSKANGEFLIFLDSDDELNIDSLENYHELVRNEYKVGFFSSGLISPVKKQLPRLDIDISKFRFLNIPGSFGMKKSIFNEIGGYDEHLSHSENWEMTGRALKYCEKNDFKIVYQNKYNLNYNFESFPSKNYKRNKNKAHASLYLYKKYSSSGVFHFNKNTFLLEAAINSIRIKNIKRARILLRRSLQEKFSIKTLGRLIISYVPFLREKLWKNN